MIATLGEALVDMIQQADGHYKACLGGGPYNFSIGTARQGVATTYLNPLSQDHFGQQFVQQLRINGVAMAADFTSAKPTALAIVSLDEHGKPTYAFHHDQVADRDFSVNKIIASLPANLSLLHTGTLALIPQDVDKVIAVLDAVRSRDALVSVDANMRPIAVDDVDAYVHGVQRALRHAHIVKASDEDLQHLGLHQTDFHAAAKSLFHHSGVQLVALTLGARGAALLTRAQTVESAVPTNLQLIDTVGAGDCFHAGLIAYLSRANKLNLHALQQCDEKFLQAALRHAVSAASLNIMRAGCDPATWEQTQAFSKTW